VRYASIACLILLAGVLMYHAWWLDPRQPRAKVVFVGLFLLGIEAVMVWMLVAPFRFHVDERGLDLRLPEVRGPLPWAEIDVIVLEHGNVRPWPGSKVRAATRLLLVPARGTRLSSYLPLASPVDGRPCRVLMDLLDVSARPDEVARTLARYGGDRSWTPGS
jgi:hypothetical protein